MSSRLLSLILLSFLAMVPSASASVVSYFLSGGTVSGTLNGVAFTNANYTITAQADPSSFNSGLVSSTFPVEYAVATSTVTIDGFSPFQVTQANFGPFVIDTTLFGLGYDGGFGIYDGTLVSGFVARVGSLTGDPIAGTGSIIGTNSVNFSTMTTTAGLLTYGSFTGGVATFTASPSSAVPEPTSMVIFGLSALGIAFRNRRKVTK